MRFLSLSVGAFALAARAAMTGGLPYSVRLVDGNGQPLAAGEHACVFTVWDAPSKGSCVWSNDVTCAILGTDGLLSVTIGGDAAFATAMNALCAGGKTAYLETRVDGVTLPVRSAVGHAAFATVAENVSSVSKDFLAQGATKVGGNLTVKGGADFGADTRVGEKLEVGGSGVISNGTFDVAGAAAIGRGLSVSNALTVTGGGLTAPAAMAVGGTFAPQSLAVGGAAKAGAANIAFPKGTILFWNGAQGEIPKDWHLCDGTDGTPDMRGMFARGGRSKDEGRGGEALHVLTESEIPAHRHGNENDKFKYWGSSLMSTSGSYFLCGGMGQESKTAAAGENKGHENRPPYYALYYIMKMK